MIAMNPLAARFIRWWLIVLLLVPWSRAVWGAEPSIQIVSPKDRSEITQEQRTILVGGRVISGTAKSFHADLLFVIDVSGSTHRYAGVDFGDLPGYPDRSQPPSMGLPQIGLGGLSLGPRPGRNLRNSILGAEVGAARRLLLQLNSDTTRVGVIAFGEGAKLLQSLTHDFEQVRRALDEILSSGPRGGTNMADGIRLGITELMGLGKSEKSAEAVKVQLFFTDGFPTLPIGRGKMATAEDTDFAINAARLAGRAGIKIHVFALGDEVLSYPRAAVGIAKESGGSYTPVSRPADVLAVVENISVVGVDYVQVFNETMAQKASHLRLAADGTFSSAVPVIEGANRIQVSARSSDGSVGRKSITVHFQPGGRRSLDLQVFLEREQSLKLEVDRLE
jgi:hypothetical protein